MKIKRTFLNLFVLTSLLSCKIDDTTILNNTVSKLSSLKTIEYDWNSIISSNEDKEFNQEYYYKIYFDFSSNDSIINTKYLFKTKFGEVLFDGEKQYMKEIALEVVMYQKSPNKDILHSANGMSHSIYEVKNILPKLLSDPTIKYYRKNDTIINKMDCYKFNFVIPNRSIHIDFIKDNDSINDFTSNYTIAISKKNNFPILIKSSFSNSEIYRLSLISNIKLNVNRENEFNIKGFQEKFPLVEMADVAKFLDEKIAEEVVRGADNFQLNSIKGNSISLSDFKDKLVLLEFWFPGCKGCLMATPVLNQLQEKYKKDGLVILGIEYTNDSEKSLKEYIKKQNIKTITLIKGKEVAEKYNVQGAPMFFLINKKGEIIYSTMGLSESLEKEINRQIEISKTNSEEIEILVIK